MPGFRRFAFGAGVLGIASVVACAAMVGADVDDVRGESSEDAGHTNVPRDAGSADDAGPVLDAGGACPAGSGLTSCVVGGLDTSSPTIRPIATLVAPSAPTTRTMFPSA